VGVIDSLHEQVYQFITSGTGAMKTRDAIMLIFVLAEKLARSLLRTVEAIKVFLIVFLITVAFCLFPYLSVVVFFLYLSWNWNKE
jgi:hypothetical protein